MSSRTAWPILGASLLTTLGTLPVFLLASQSVPLRADLGFGERQFGVAVAAFFTAAAVAAVLGGGLVDRMGPRSSRIVAGVLSMTGALGITLAVHGWLPLVACMGVLGLANAACQLTANLAMAQSIPAHRRGIGFGMKQSAIPVAIVLAGLAVPTMTTSLGWRSTYWVVAGGGLLVVLLGLLSRSPERTVAKGGRVDRDAPPVRALLVVMVAIALASAASNSLGAFVASWGFEVGLSPSRAGVLMATGSALNVVARLLSGFLADRRHGRNLPVVAGQMLVGGVALAVLSLPMTTTYVAATVVAFAIGWSWPGLFLFAVVRIGRDAPAMASGYVQAGAFAGGAAGPLVFGIAVDAIGYSGAWRVAALAFVAASALVLVGRAMFLKDLIARPPRQPLGYGGGRAAPRWTTGEREGVDDRRHPAHVPPTEDGAHGRR